jgi:hypothetical protein
MNEKHEELISAALDGEAVDLVELKRALAVEEGRELLASFVLLRAELAADGIVPGRLPQSADPDSVPCPAVEVDFHPPAMVASRGPRVFYWMRNGPRVSLGLAASIAILAVAGAFWAGLALRANVVLQPAAQEAQSHPKVHVAAPAVSSETSAPAPVEQKISAPKTSSAGPQKDVKTPSWKTILTEPPKPARVLRFIPGTDWSVSS